ncbi:MULTISPECIES: AraC family transcriptional regulator [unclassified Undibacterium]|uniref:AraC family transcriptional regulator n=2 Tax=Pseudomonadota TaxID=1224 RepID=UPI002AC95AEF|nr:MULTISPECIES: AraC family transcriptional regulator [unclassified Undibacterium]MEB0139750.1 AraC family transcriptional regulator [Undibacterium sp. CCC2.1]MEB0172631.1 AraC family transcriptional regulator [Undibacterium sp. CCC1.1]MEB0176388.1 AraC family transcriptional regulator [Undibacterium sp. CCC3.4]MEB0215754.1 AraC family transcriptional regulator [Undibacterium sp. 5I2]WPX45175.1 AraC family transcriptional regulator [Undibacterium sp. CCC3.4]
MEKLPQTQLSNSHILLELLSAIAATDGDHLTSVPGLTIYRRSKVSEPIHCIYGLGLGLTVQGSKRVSLGGEIFDYAAGQSLVTSLDLPVLSSVTSASEAQPFFALGLALDARSIAQCAAEMTFPAAHNKRISLAMSVLTLDEGVLDTLVRLLRLVKEPQLLPLLAPLIKQEMIVRLLHGGHGQTLRHLIHAGSPGQQIAKLISWLKQHYTEDISMQLLATRAHMSPSTFRQHFRAVAGLSPLQYLKQLRLQDARQRMLNQDIDAASAAIQVGYESASQFSREYTRLFGAPPLRDIRRARAQ